MNEENMYETSVSHTSGYTAILEDDGVSCWLYLLKSENTIADIWVYNRIEAPEQEDLIKYEGMPPPLVKDFASRDATCFYPKERTWAFVWSKDGTSVAITKNTKPIACVIGNIQQGYSKGLFKKCPWGNTWSDVIYSANFE